MTEDPKIPLIRHSAGSVDISDLKEKEMTESERKKYAGEIYVVFPILEEDIKRLMKEQILLIAESENWEKVNYGRGTCNGISLLYDLWKKVVAEHQAKPSEPPSDPHSPIGEI